MDTVTVTDVWEYIRLTHLGYTVVWVGEGKYCLRKPKNKASEKQE